MAALLRTFEGGPSISDEDVKLFERRYGLILPATYRRFLLATNGGRPERDLFSLKGFEGHSPGRIHVFFGLNDPVESCNLDWNLEVFGDRIPTGLLPIATTEGADKICLSVDEARSGQVLYWDGGAHAGERILHFLADDFASFVSSLQVDGLSPGVLRS